MKKQILAILILPTLVFSAACNKEEEPGPTLAAEKIFSQYKEKGGMLEYQTWLDSLENNFPNDNIIGKVGKNNNWFIGHLDTGVSSLEETEEKTYGFTILPSKYGTIETDKGTAAVGENVTITVKANRGYEFQSLFIDYNEITKDDFEKNKETYSISIEMKEGGYNVYGIFSTKNEPRQKIKVALIGDSLTAMYNHINLYVKINMNVDIPYYYEMLNFGVGGAAVTPDGWFSYDITDYYAASVAYAPDIINILMGSNDSPNWQAARNRYIDCYSKMLEDYKHSNPKVVINLFTSPSFAIPYQSHDICNELQLLQKDVADLNKTRFYDFNSRLLAKYFEDPIKYFDYFIDDLVHLTPKGYLVFENMYFDAIKKVSLDDYCNKVDDLIITNANVDSSSISFELFTNNGVLTDDLICKIKGNEFEKTYCIEEKAYCDGLKEDSNYSLEICYSLNGSEKKINYNFHTLKKIKIAFIGDSLTDDRLLLWEHLGRIESYAHTEWIKDDIKRIYNKSVDIEINNFAQAGASVTQCTMPFITTDRYQESLAYAPDVVFTLLGSNDYYLWDQYQASYKNEYIALLETYKQVNPSVKFVILTSPPLLDVYSDQSTTIRNSINILQKEVAEEIDAQCWDLYEFFIGYSNTVTRPQWYTIFADWIHFNPNGSRMIGKYIFSKMIKYFSI